MLTTNRQASETRFILIEWVPEQPWLFEEGINRAEVGTVLGYADTLDEAEAIQKVWRDKPEECHSEWARLEVRVPQWWSAVRDAQRTAEYVVKTNSDVPF